MNWLWKRLALYGGLFLLVIGVMKYLSYKLNQFDSDYLSTNLKSNEKAKVTIDTKTGEVKKIDSQGVKSFGKGNRKVVISLTKDNKLEVNGYHQGFIFEPGLTLFSSDMFRAGLDVQFLFWHEFSLSAGIGTNPNKQARSFDAYGAVNYTMPFDWCSDTSIFLGYSARRQIVIGSRVRF